MASCSLDVKVRNKEGQVVDSILYKQLRQYYGNKTEADKVYFRVATNPQWLQNLKYYDKDVNGEITFKSLLANSGINLEDNRIIKVLNQQLNSGNYSFAVAQDKVQLFNANNDFNNNYMATLEYDKNSGDFNVHVVKRTPENQQKLERTLKHSYAFNVIMDALKKLGVSVDFVDPAFILGDGEYNTRQYETTKNGLLTLIKVAENPDTVIEDSVLAEEAGHFIVGCLSNDEIYTRFANWLNNKEHRNAVSVYDDKVGATDIREIMGDLVGKKLNGENIPSTVAGRFIKRMFNKLHQLLLRSFGQIGTKEYREQNTIKADILQAEMYAEQMAEKLIHNKITQQQVQTALQHKEIKYSAELPVEIKEYRHALSKIKQFLSDVETITPSAEKIIGLESGQALFTIATNNRGQLLDNEHISILDASQALMGIAEILDKVTEQCTQFMDTLNSMDLSSEGFGANAITNAKKIILCRSFVSECVALLDIVDNLKTATSRSGLPLNNVQVVNSFGITTSFDIEGLQEKLQKLVYGIKSTTDIQGKTDSYRRDRSMWELLRYAERRYAEELVYSQTGFRRMPETKVRTLFGHKAKDISKKVDSKGKPVSITVADIISDLEQDVNWFDAFIKSASMSRDILVQSADKIIRQGRDLANKRTNDDFTELDLLKGEMIKNGIKDTIIFCEEETDKSKKNRFTGNFIQHLNYGEWEQKKHDFYQSEAKKFFKDYKEKHPQASENEISLAFYDNMHEKMKKWHEENSKKNDNFGKDHFSGNMKYIPNDSYINKNYYLNISENATEIAKVLGVSQAEAQRIAAKNKNREHYLNELMSLKQKYDLRVGEDAPPFYRLPQFKGKVGRRLKSRNKNKVSGYAWDMIKEDVFVSSEDREFGTDDGLETVEEDPAHNEYDYEYSKAIRLPLYGIRKLHNMAELNTDLFTTLLGYASMSNDYDCLKIQSEALTILSQVSGDRKVLKYQKDKANQSANATATRTHKRLLRHINKNVFGTSYYGWGSKYWKIKGKVNEEEGTVKYWQWSWIKLGNMASGLARWLFLGGNVHGATVNLGTGFIEIYKESIAGQYFNQKEFWNALYTYEKELLLSLPETAKTRIAKRDKLSLLLRQFDVLGDLNESFRNWDSTRNRGMNLLSEIVMLPYKQGDHAMQAIPFLAMMEHQKVYQKMPDGTIKTISLKDAYEVKEVSLEDIRGFQVKQNQSSIKRGNTVKVLKLKEGIYKTDDPAEIKKIEQLGELQKEIMVYLQNVQNGQNALTTSINFNKYKDLLEDDSFWEHRNRSGELEKMPYRKHESIQDIKNLQNTIQERINRTMWNEVDETDFQGKFRLVANSMHGVYNKLDKAVITQTLLGNMLSTMKGYAFGMAQRRFNGFMGGAYYNIYSQQDMEGSLVSSLKFLLNTWTKYEGKRQGFSTLWMLCPVVKAAERSIKSYGYSENQYRNIRRTWADFMAIGILYAMTFMFAKPKKDPDETREEYAERVSQYQGIAYYLTNRLFLEQTAFNSPVHIKSEAMQLFDIVPAGLSGMWAIGQTLDLWAKALNADVEDDNYDRTWKKAWDKTFSMLPYLKTTGNTVPFVDLFGYDAKIIPTIDTETSRPLEDPYKATESFYFTRNRY